MRLGGSANRRSIRLVAIGASFVEQGGFDHLQGLLGGRVKFSKVATGGHRSDQIAARIAGEVLPLDPDIVIVDAGGNDVLQDIATSTIQANLLGIYDDLESEGVQCMSVSIQVFGSLYAPTDPDTYPERIEARLAMNEWIEAQGRPFFSYDDAVGDGTLPNPELVPAYDGGDYLHLSLAGKVRQSFIAHRQLFGSRVW
jgi:lysophospholipase L1-like esterase